MFSLAVFILSSFQSLISTPIILHVPPNKQALLIHAWADRDTDDEVVFWPLPACNNMLVTAISFPISGLLSVISLPGILLIAEPGC